MLQNPQQKAGAELFAAVEEALGQTGVTAVARRTSRDKSWWSRFRREGRGAFPTWAELAAALSGSLDPGALDRLRRRYLEALLLHFDPEHVRAVAGMTLTPERLAGLRSLERLARAAWERGDWAVALEALRAIREALDSAWASGARPDVLRLRADVLYGEGVCELHLKNGCAAIVSVRSAASLYEELGEPAAAREAEHTRALALLQLRRCPQALKEFAELSRRYRPDDLENAVRARRDGAQVRLAMGRVAEAVLELRGALKECRPEHERARFYTLLWLTIAAVALGDAGQARDAWEQFEALVRARPERYGDALAYPYERDHRESLRRNVPVLLRRKGL